MNYCYMPSQRRLHKGLPSRFNVVEALSALVVAMLSLHKDLSQHMNQNVTDGKRIEHYIIHNIKNSLNECLTARAILTVLSERPWGDHMEMCMIRVT